MARKKHLQPASAEELTLSRSQSAEYYNGKLRSRSRKRVIRIILSALLAVLVTGGVAVASFVNDINTKITGHVDSTLKDVLAVPEPGKPFYLLLIGIDKDEGRVNDPSYGKDDSGYRSDSIMLTRIDPQSKQVTMVSIHRDTMYDFGADGGVQKINAAYTIGQETYTTKTISDFAGVPISHYAEVDMDGMAAVIDAIGGIDVEIDMDIKDPYYTGLDLKKGKHHLDGHTAALFCRCRHAYDALGDGDRYRAANQRKVISIVAKKVLTSNPATIAKTVSTMASYVRTDMDVQSIINLALQFVGMDFENSIYTGMEPTTALYTNATWYEICDEVAWKKMMQRVDQGLPPTEEGDADPLVGSDAAVDASGLIGSTSGEEGYYDENYYDYNYDNTQYYEEEQYYDDSQDSSYEEPPYEQQSTVATPEPEPEPSNEEPPYEEPAYEEPVYEEPTYEEPATDDGGDYTADTSTEVAPSEGIG